MIITIITFLFILYTVFAISSYLTLATISTIEARKYLRKNKFVNYKEILSSTISPSISIIAPAYNESLNIVENVRSLLSNHYANYDVIIVNDGSKDDSLSRLINAYSLIQVNYVINPQIPTMPLRQGVYKSTNPAFEKLIVVDKVNGGKADALNTGLNISTNDYVVCIDVDCVLVEDALQKMIKPVLEATNKRVIASGGVIRIANSCIIRDGKLIDINLPKSYIVKGQILEYIRSFLLARMAWSKLNGLLIISGAFGLFDKKIAIAAGGYDHNTVGEDMEIVVRMQRYMLERNEKYAVTYIPDPLCWTEAPDSYRILISQRNRWTRGTIETLKMHRKIGFNPKYKVLGLLSYPYWLFFERLAPIVEVAGLLYFFVLWFLDKITWSFSIVLIIAAYLFTVLFSLLALLAEELTYHQYSKKGMGTQLIIMAFLEPFIIHPFVLYAALKGNYDYIFNKKKKWGEMVRKGMTH